MCSMMSVCLSDITGATACARKFVNNMGSWQFGNGIFGTVCFYLKVISCLLLVRKFGIIYLFTGIHFLINYMTVHNHSFTTNFSFIKIPWSTHERPMNLFQGHKYCNFLLLWPNWNPLIFHENSDGPWKRFSWSWKVVTRGREEDSWNFHVCIIQQKMTSHPV